MKVLQINVVNDIRSTGRTTLETSMFLEENGHEGYVAYSVGTDKEKNYKISTFYSTKVHSLLSRISGKQAYFSKQDTKKLIIYMEEIKPDIVHLRNLHGNYIHLNNLLKYLSTNDIPTVLTLHDCWFYTGKCTHYTEDNCYKWQLECKNCPRLKKDNPSWFLDRTNKMYKEKKKELNNIPRLAVVGVSDWITNEARKSFLRDSKILTRIYNWIDMDIFKPVKTYELRSTLNLEDKFIILGVASIWNNSKGLNKFIDIAKELPDDIRIVMVGEIDEKIIIPKNIIHLKETHNTEELVRYYSLADVLLNLSSEETFGKVTAESLACGTPAIVINSTANPELIGKDCGYIINKDNNDLIFDKIQKIKERKKEFYSEACISYAKKNFLKEERLKDYLNLYNELLSI